MTRPFCFENMDEKLLQQFVELISKKTGICIKSEDVGKVKRHIFSRLRFLKFADTEDYYNLLKTDVIDSRREWKKLVILITTGESYFFRDKGQFALLKDMILPDLIEKRKRERSLKIWSAGCSTGEEPYSVAILLDELLMDMKDWDILILGTDINEEALEKAKTGIYTDWSFRMAEPDLKMRYFKKQNDNLKLDEGIKNMVRFSCTNLTEDSFPNPASGIQNMDLILCRNVFIYFQKEAIALVVKKFIDTLNEGGYLMTGHGELHLHDYRPLQARIFSESVVYQKNSEHPNSEFRNAELKEKTAEARFEEAKTEGQSKIQISESKIEENSAVRNPHSLLELAQEYADKGEYKKAVDSCKKAIAINPEEPVSYFLLSQIAEIQGNDEEAEGLLKKTMYLKPDFVPAYLEIASYYDKEGDADRAKKMRLTAIELLERLKPYDLIEPYKDITAGELLEYVRKMMM